MNLEQLGLFGVFIAGAIPWFEAIGVVPGGILIGFNPVATVIAAAAGNLITIVVFSYAGSNQAVGSKPQREEGKTAALRSLGEGRAQRRQIRNLRNGSLGANHHRHSVRSSSICSSRS